MAREAQGHQEMKLFHVKTKPRPPQLAFSHYSDAPLNRKAYAAWYMRNIYRPKIAKILKTARKTKP